MYESILYVDSKRLIDFEEANSSFIDDDVTGSGIDNREMDYLKNYDRLLARY